MIYAFCGFMFGILIPYIARRFAKFMPATLAYGICQTIRSGKKVSSTARKKNPKYKKLSKKYFWRSIVFGLATACLSFGLYNKFGSAHIIWYSFFLWTLILLAEIDKRMYLLPDILTIPLLIGGFVYSVIAGEWVNPAESAFGAAIGYLLPAISSLLLVWKNKDMFGGGDIKLLAALGAWLGPVNLLYTIIVSTIFFAVYALLQKRKDGAYGPSAALAAIAVVFWM